MTSWIFLHSTVKKKRSFTDCVVFLNLIIKTLIGVNYTKYGGSRVLLYKTTRS